MRTISTFLILIFFILEIKAQDCPSNFELRNIKCNGEILTSCVPVNYNCVYCWTIEWAKCDGNFNGISGADFKNSYHACIEEAERVKQCTLYRPCPDEIMDKFNFRIFLNDSKFCNQSGKDVAIGFTKRMIAEIINYRRFLNGQTQIPSTAIIEYKSVLDEGETNANNFLNLLNNIDVFGSDKIEKAYQNLQIEERNLNAVFSKLILEDEDEEPLPKPQSLSTSNNLEQQLSEVENALYESTSKAISELNNGSSNTSQWAEQNIKGFNQQSASLNTSIKQQNNDNNPSESECPQAQLACDNETTRIKNKGIYATPKETMQAQANCIKAFLQCPNISSEEKIKLQQELDKLENIINQL